MEDRCICCGSIIPEGRQVCPVCESKNTKYEIGDIIVCYDRNQCVKTMTELAKAGITADFLYDRDEEKGLWLEVTEIENRKE